IHHLDAPSIVITAVTLLTRALIVAGVIRFELPPIVITLLTLASIGFYAVDYFYISRSFIPAAIHLVFFPRQNYGRRSDRAIGRRRSVRFALHPAHHVLPVLLPAAHRARGFPA